MDFFFYALLIGVGVLGTLHVQAMMEMYQARKNLRQKQFEAQVEQIVERVCATKNLFKDE